MRPWLGSILLVAMALAAGPAALAEGRGGTMKQHPMGMGMSAEQHEAMMEAMRARQEKLDELVAAMEAAEGAERVDAIAAVVKEMVVQRRDRMERMETMHERMMESMRGSGESPEPQGSEPAHEHGD